MLIVIPGVNTLYYGGIELHLFTINIDRPHSPLRRTEVSRARYYDYYLYVAVLFKVGLE